MLKREEGAGVADPSRPGHIRRASSLRATRRWIAATLGTALLLPASLLGGTAPAQAADGHGDGRALQLAVAADSFSISGTTTVDIVPSKKYPGTVRFERNGGKQCLATKDGKNDRLPHLVQWTGCNGHSSKNWVLEPSHTMASPVAPGQTVDDDTLASLNTVNTGEQPRFIIRSYRYPKQCVFSTGNGLEGGKVIDWMGAARGIAPDCSEPNITGHDVTIEHMQFVVVNDTEDRLEWEFLRSQMRVGAIAMYERGLDSAFSGENLWVRPTSVDGEYVGLASKASAGGYFLPQAVEIDPVKEQAVVNRASSSRGCFEGSWWWGLDNTRGQIPFPQEVKVGQQKTDEFGWSLGLEAGVEGEGSLAFFKGKYSVKVSGSIHKSWSTSKTTERTVTIGAPSGQWGMAVVTTPSVTTLGTWKTGTALNRVWRFGGASTVALKDSAGEPTGTAIAQVNSHVRKACRALAETGLEPGVTPNVILAPQRIAPQVGDTLTASAPFVDPQTGNPLDVRYQWYADDKPLSNQTLATLVVTEGMVGKQLSFTTYESGGSMRFESPTYLSEQTAPVVTTAVTASAAPIALHEGIAGRSVELSIAGVGGLADTLAIDEDQLPPGVSFDAASGSLIGVPSVPGIYAMLVTDDTGAEAEVALTIDAAPTQFASESGFSVPLGTPLELPLVEELGTDASYIVEYFNESGDPAVPPAGLAVSADSNGRPVLSGTPTAAGEVLVRVTEQSPYHAAGDARPTVHELRLNLTPAPSTQPSQIDAPTISFTQLPGDDGKSHAPAVDQLVSWHATASEADQMSAVVHRVGNSAPVTWAEAARTLASEIEIDAVPEAAGNYEITVTASNQAGTTTRSFAFEVAGTSPNGGGGSNGAGSPTADGTQQLSHTGQGFNTTVVLTVAAAALLLGGYLVYRSHSRRSKTRG